MPSPKPTLDDLRREIDEIDDALHDLVMRRSAVVERIAGLKPTDRASIRPAREAEILRRLVARHEGALPVAALVRMWREMIGALTRLQAPLIVAVYAPDDQRAFWDLARDHYGSATPMTAVNTPMAALRCVAEGTATVAVLPLPEEEDADPWWRYLFSTDTKAPRIISRLPFLSRSGRGDEVDGLAIAVLPLEPTGDDRTFLGLELAENISRGRLKDLLDACGLVSQQLRTFHLPGSAGAVHLVEADGFVAADDPRLESLSQRLGDALVRAQPLGAYAVPIAVVESRKG